MSVLAARELDRLAYRDGPVHRLDARAKLLVVATFVVCVASFPRHEVARLLPFALLPGALVALAAVPLRPILRVAAAGAPFALLVGAAGPFLDRAPLARVGPFALSGGTLALASILLRYALCSTTLLLLVATTPLPRLARALRALRVPAAFVVQLQLLYRYLFLLAGEGERLAAARLLREPGRRLPRLATARGMLYMLLHRSWERGDRIYRCMEVRGFTGELPALAPERFRAVDATWLTAGILGCVALRALPLARWLGEALLS